MKQKTNENRKITGRQMLVEESQNKMYFIFYRNFNLSSYSKATLN